ATKGKDDKPAPAVKIWDMNGKMPKLLKTYGGMTRQPYRAAWSPDGKTLVYATASGEIVVLDASSGKKLKESALPAAHAAPHAFALDSRHLAIGLYHGTTCIGRLSGK